MHGKSKNEKCALTMAPRAQTDSCKFINPKNHSTRSFYVIKHKTINTPGTRIGPDGSDRKFVVSFLYVFLLVGLN